ncbi:hypothetical protein [Kribbella capetownensis]|uniref:hypothetical protein n=1 Tax=Kribbella capetownensis TaxID=1572659 RepID=UPI001EDFE26E|nr:hypothetical protein [Kribbella capetownensis]
MLDPVPDHALRLGDQIAEWVRPRQSRVRRTLQRQQPDLRAVAMDNDHGVFGGDRSQRRRRRGQSRDLDVGIGAFAPPQ